MMAEKPWFGYGWNQPERIYNQFYRPSNVPEGAAIQLNDYFTLGTTLGIPALLCFIIYVGLALSPKSKVQSPKSPPSSDFRLRPTSARQVGAARKAETSVTAECGGHNAECLETLDIGLGTLDLAAVCRSAAAVLVVGFWFDGGLFKLATAAPFWILLELGREDLDTDGTNLHG
jgi:hypothetical protein